MKKHEKPRVISQDRAQSVINSDNNPASKVAELQDGINHHATNPGYEPDE
jgi:hypothetical protein